MASIVPNNTLGIGREITCARPRRGQPFCQLVQYGDVTMFQVADYTPEYYPDSDYLFFIVSPAEVAILSQIGTGTSLVFGSTVILGDPVQGGRTSTGSKLVYYEPSLTDPYGKVIVDFDITLCSGMTAKVYAIPFVDGVLVEADKTLITTFTDSGNHSLEYINPAATQVYIAIQFEGTCGEGLYSYLSEFSVHTYEQDMNIADVLDSEGNIVTNLIVDHFGIARLNWTESIPEGCYTICLREDVIFAENIFPYADNGTFEANADDVSSDFTAERSTAQAFNSDYSYLVQYVPLTFGNLLNAYGIEVQPGKTYRLQARIYIDGLYAVQDAYVAIDVDGDATYGSSGIAEPVTGKQWVEIFVEFTMNSIITANTIDAVIYGSGNDWAGDTNIYIDNIALYNISDLPDYCTGCLSLKETHPCSLKLEWWNDSNAYGFDYENGLKHSLRIAGSLANSSYDGEKEVFTDTTGKKRIVFAQKEKKQELAINDVPEYIHDALAIGIDHDNFMIDGKLYVVEESGYEPQWRKTSDLAPAVLDVRLQTQNLRNANC